MPRSDWVLECCVPLLSERSAAPLADRPACSFCRSAPGLAWRLPRTELTWRIRGEYVAKFRPARRQDAHTSASRSVSALLGRATKYPPLRTAMEFGSSTPGSTHNCVLGTRPLTSIKGAASSRWLRRWSARWLLSAASGGPVDGYGGQAGKAAACPPFSTLKMPLPDCGLPRS